MATYTVKAVKYCEQLIPGPAAFYLSHWDEWFPVDFYFWILRRDDGAVVLVDTGNRDVDEIQPAIVAGVGEKGRFRMDMRTQAVPMLLAKEGIRPEDVKAVVLTHLHYDHCSNVHLFPNATVVVSGRGFREARAPRHPGMYPHPVFPRDTIEYLAGPARSRVIFAEEEHRAVLPGIDVFWVGAHSPCCQAIKVRTAKGPVILPSDTILLYRNLDEPSGLINSLVDCLDAMKRVKDEAALVVPAHDPDVLKRHPGGVIA